MKELKLTGLKAYFIFRDGKVFGSPVGYTTIQGAKKALVGCEDYLNILYKYDLGNGRTSVPQEFIDLGLYVWSDYVKSYLFNREVWTRKIWNKYRDEHYEITEKEFDIIFKD